jgi:hypothetical protein
MSSGPSHQKVREQVTTMYPACDSTGAGGADKDLYHNKIYVFLLGVRSMIQ